MKRSHNKKRNVGIIYELLLRNISNALIENDKKKASEALKIIEKRFDESTELYREFRLFNALAKSTISDSAVAAAILTEAKGAARRCDSQKLSKEKSYLIRDINHILKDDSFYHRRISEYKIYATIQTLLNEWRKEDRSDLSKMVQYEAKVINWLLQEKEEKDIDDISNPDVNQVVVKIMTEKINEKYKGKIEKNQRDLIKSYVFSISSDNYESIRRDLSNSRNEAIRDLDSFKTMTSNKILLEKIDRVKQKITGQEIQEITDESISKFLVIMQLRNEIKESLNE
tara:strand:- start:972 stop:1826 length:855 start_codon:yes stop_codon:yes gene_type:complete